MPSSSSGLYQLDATGLTRRRAQRLNRSYTTPRGTTGSEAGGDRAAILYSVLETAKLNGLDPETYLADVIDRMAKGHPINRLGELLPWNWTRQAVKLAA